MNASLLRLLLIGKAVLAAAVAGWLMHRGWSVVTAAVAGLLVPIALHAGVIGFDFWLSRLTGSPLPTPAPGERPASLIRVWLRETVDSLSAFSWRMPFQGDRPLPSAPAPGREGPMPVLLLHGYGCNRAVWLPMARELASRGHVIGSVNLEPPQGAIDGYADGIAAGIDELCRRTGHEQVALVCHSMGGLAARAYLRRHGDGAVSKVVTLGSPHRGTVLARFGHGANVAQMRRDSPWLRALAADETDERRRLFTCVLTHHDNIVFPQSIQTLPGAETIALSGIGHLSLLTDPGVAQLVAQRLTWGRDGAAPRTDDRAIAARDA